MALTDTEKMILIVLLAVIMSLVLYFEVRVMRGKAKEVRKVGVKKDAAFNAIHTVRSVLNVLERQGSDVSAARKLLTSSKEAMLRGEYERSMELSENAKEELTKTKKFPPRTPAQAEDQGVKDRLELMAEAAASSPKKLPAVPATDSYSGSKLQDDKGMNYMGAKFEINTARGDVSKAAASGRDVFRAEQLIQGADAEFSRGNYSKALSLAVKARKEVSVVADGETIPLKAGDGEELPAPPPEIDEVSDMESPKGRCVTCSTPSHDDDLFCAKCGTKILRDRKCPSCGSKPRESDAFCRKCGSRIP